MYDISIIMPAIRTPNWNRMYDSIKKSCKRYSFELVMCGPFPLTEELAKEDNVRMIIDNGSPSRCAQIAAINADGRLLAHLVDDALFIEDSLDQCVDLYDTVCDKKDVINLRYTEALNFRPTHMHKDYWYAWFHGPLKHTGVPKDYKIACHHLIDTEYFKELGGYDCSFEYQNFNLHDLMFRVQKDGGTLFDSPNNVTNCDWYPNGMVDHKAIEQAYVDNDEPLFAAMYSDPDVLSKRIYIELDNWKQTEELWSRRFSKGVPKDYNEILENN